MTRLFFGAAALMVAVLMSDAAPAQPPYDRRPLWSWPLTSDPGWSYYQHPNTCMVWDGYRWLNMCWRSRTFVYPAWARFHR
jgi:hypothetical protein